MLNWITSRKSTHILGIVVLFAAISWGFYIHIPTLSDGYLNAGDDHVHVAFSNELARIWEGEGRFLGWSRLYAAGAPIFILRPPGFYAVTTLTHFLTGLTVEQSLKLTVLFGFCLYPLTIFIGGRLLGLGFRASLFAGLLSPLAISLWGHTIDAYQYLGVYKQMFAILIFPIAVGSLWRLMQKGEHGLLFAITFPAMFITHPYIAFCFALLGPCMLISLATLEPQWNWKATFIRTSMWLVPALLFMGIWLIPYVTSPEAQVFDPFLGRRNYFEVIVCTAAETLRQFFLGGILDTTRYSGPFGGTEWIAGAEWGWLKNDRWFRFPVITFFATVGWLVVMVRPKPAVRAFLGLAFLLSLIIFMGPDDFPVIDWVPFAIQFQNIHGIFLLEWAAIILGGFAINWLLEAAWSRKKQMIRYSMTAGVLILVTGAILSGYVERTLTAKRLIDVRNIYTDNGQLEMRPGIFREWAEFKPIVDELNISKEAGNVMGFPQEHDDSVLYNLLPLMVDRQVFICGFVEVGGIYDLLLHRFRGPLRDNYPMQKMFNIRYVLNSPSHRKVPMVWHESTEPLYSTKHWEMVKVKGEFGEFNRLPKYFVAFMGTEREWAVLMHSWLSELRDGATELPQIVNLTNSGLSVDEQKRILPLIKMLVLGKDMEVPHLFNKIEHIHTDWLDTKPAISILNKLKDKIGSENSSSLVTTSLDYDVVELSRSVEKYHVEMEDKVNPIVFKRMFYRGWKAAIDGVDTPIYRVSPGLQMVVVPEGSHELSWYYTGPNYWNWAKNGFWLGLAIVVILMMLGQSKTVEKRSKADSRIRRVIVYLPAILWAVFIGVLVLKTISEAYYRIPVTVRPHADQVLAGGNEDFFWNNVIGIKKEKQKFRIEIATDPDFKNVIESKVQTGFTARVNGIFSEARPYYYRIRLEVEDTKFSWSKPIRVFGQGEEI